MNKKLSGIIDRNGMAIIDILLSNDRDGNEKIILKEKALIDTGCNTIMVHKSLSDVLKPIKINKQISQYNIAFNTQTSHELYKGAWQMPLFNAELEMPFVFKEFKKEDGYTVVLGSPFLYYFAFTIKIKDGTFNLEWAM